MIYAHCFSVCVWWLEKYMNEIFTIWIVFCLQISKQTSAWKTMEGAGRIRLLM